LIPTNISVKIYRTIIWPVTLYGCDTLSLTLKEGHWLRAFKNRVLREIFGPKSDEVTGEWRGLHSEKFYDLYSSLKYYSGYQIKNTMCGAHGEEHLGFWCGNLRERDNLEDFSTDGRIILKYTFKKWDGRAWTGLIWVRILTGGRCLCMG
jgi:hypothetical protein